MNTRGKNERGVSALEYGLLVAACVLAFAVAMIALGDAVKASYHQSAPPCSTNPGATVCTDDTP